MAAASLRTSAAFHTGTGQATYQLSDRLLFVASDSVWVNDSLWGRDSYRLDYATGLLSFLRPVPDSALVHVSYQRLPDSELRPSYYRRRDPGAESSATHAPLIIPDTLTRVGPDSETGEELLLGGSKTITASLGNGGLGLDQSLRLNVQGQVAGVKLDAVLSDQKTGIPVEGTTRELAELDKVAIKFSAPNLDGSLGDYDYRQDCGQLGSVSRRMRGFELGAAFSDVGPNPGQAQARAGYSKPKGRYGRNQFMGEDGRQGPYSLTGDAPEVTVVPGSEVVALDGQQLVRGMDRDYTIEYGLAELTFTNRHQISSRSRITADFEYTTDEYDRTTLTGQAGYDFGPAQVKLGAFREGDDRNAHLAGAFSAADQESLVLAGRDTAIAWLPGADSLGPGKGDYVRAGDHFRFVGLNQGEFQVYFTLVGDSVGEYAYDNAVGGYVFVGPAQGNYVARRRVRLPERTEVYFGDLDLRFQPDLSGRLSGVLSRRNQNLFSAVSPRTGLGYHATVNWLRERYGLSFTHRTLGHDFTFPGSMGEPDFSYQWNLARSPSEYGRDELSGFVQPLEPVKLDALLGWLRSPEVERKRGHLGVSGWFANYGLDRIGNLTRHRAALAPHVKWFSPRFSVELETDTLERQNQLAPGLALKPNDRLEFSLSWDRTSRQTRDAGTRPWQNQSLGNVYQADAQLTSYRNLDLQMILGYQDKTAWLGNENDFNQFFGLLTGSYTHPAGIRSRFNLDQRHELAIPKQEVFIRVDKGKGDYRRDSITGRYYSDTLGDYLRRLVPSGVRVPLRKTLADFSASIASWQPLAIEITSALEQELNDTARLFERLDGDVSIQVLPNQKEFSATLADDIALRADRLYSYQPERTWEHEPSLEIRLGRDGPLTGTARLELPYRSQTGFDGALIDRESGISGLVKPVIGSGVNLELTAGYGIRNYRMPDARPDSFQIRTLTLGLRRRFEFRPQTALAAELTADKRSADVPRLPYEVSLTDPLGWTRTLTLSLDRMLGTMLVLSGNYQYTKRPDQATEHNLSVSLRAYF
jgi:hypothetical protein